MMKLFIIIVLAACNCYVFAEQKAGRHDNSKEPKLALGVITAGQVLNEYRGSKASEVKGIVAPFIYYRGDVLKVDRGGARLEFFGNHKYEFKVSGEASLSGGGKNSERREGMTELASAFEIGPSFNINLTGEDFSQGWEINLPVRAVFAFDSLSPDYIGYTVNPKFNYKFPVFENGWSMKSQVGVLYGSQKYHQYYYDVAPEFVTLSRPHYRSQSGFSGSYFKTSLRKRDDSFFYGFQVRYDNLTGAEIADSPLVETKDYFSVSFAFAYIFWSP